MNTLLLFALFFVLGLALARTVRRSRSGGGCCGEHEAMERRTPVRDRNPRHYPHLVRMEIGGMTCANCARKVENALNALPDTLARVSPDTKIADVRTMEPAEEHRLREAVRAVGYVVVRCEKVK